MNASTKRLRSRINTQTPANNHDRWMVSYADFVTLLFGFFLTMYALSSINEGRYRVLAQSIAAAFANSKPKEEEKVEVKPPPIETDNVVIKKMGDSIVQAMKPWIDQGLIKVNVSPVMLQIDINASALFSSGSSVISGDATSILESLANILSNFPNAIHVEGFTDNRPINTPVFPSNWELSAARAATVVRMFGDIGIKPTRMASVGYGEFHPVADNESSQGRARNRRVVIVVLSGTDPRSFIDVSASPKQQVIVKDKLDIKEELPETKQSTQDDILDEGEALDESVPMRPLEEISEGFSVEDLEDEEIPL